MASRTKLTELYVKFTVDGLREAEDQTKRSAQRMATTWSGIARQVSNSTRESIGQSLGSGLMGDVLRATNGATAANTLAAGRSANSWSQFAKRVSSSFRGMMAGVMAIAAPAAGLLGFARSAMEGTREGENMATAWTYLTQVVGSMFAPAIRAATGVIVMIADAIKALSPSTKAWIVMAAVGAAGVLALSGALTVASIAFVAMGQAAVFAWSMVTAPITLAVIAVVAIVAALALVIGKIEEFATTGKISSKSWVEAMIAGARVVVTTIMNAINFMITTFAEAITTLSGHAASILERLGFDETASKLKNLGFDANKWKLPVGEVEAMFKNVERMAGKLPGMGDVGKKVVKAAKELPDLIKDLFQGGPGNEMKFRPVMQVKFESLQSSFDRIQEAFAAGTPDDKLDKIREEQQETNGILGKILEQFGLQAPRPAVGN